MPKVIEVDDFASEGRDDILPAYDQPTLGVTTYGIWLMDSLSVKSMAALFTTDS